MTKREKIAIYTLLAIIAGLDVLYQILSNYYSTSGKELFDEEAEIHRLRVENNILYIEILNRGAITTIATEAADMGFVEPTFYFLK